MDTIAKRLKHARGAKSQGEVATAAKVSQSTIGNIEAGLRQARGSLPQIAEALGVSLKWLRDGEGPMQVTGHVEASESGLAMLAAFEEMADDDKREMLKDAQERAARFRRLAQEAISRHTSRETAGKDAFKVASPVPPPSPPASRSPLKYDKKNRAPTPPALRKDK